MADARVHSAGVQVVTRSTVVPVRVQSAGVQVVRQIGTAPPPSGRRRIQNMVT